MENFLNNLQGQFNNLYQGYSDALTSAYGNYQNSLNDYTSSLGNYFNEFQTQIGNSLQAYQDALGSYISSMDSGSTVDSMLQMLQSQADLNNSWSAEQAQKQMDFQERMSNTAHQREIADLKAAGLNPVLSARLGGASTPSGASATADGSILNAMVQMFDKMLDQQFVSAVAAARSAGSGSGSGSGYSGDSTGALTNSEQASLFNLFTGKGKVNAESIGALEKVINNAVNTGKGLVDKYVSPVWNSIKDSTKTAINFWKDPVGNIKAAINKNSGSATKTVGKNYSKTGVTVKIK